MQERVLKPTWGGLPTTLLLRHEGLDDPSRARRRRSRLAALSGIDLPEVAEEQADRAAADRRYEDAVAVLRTLVRKRGSDYSLVQAENISYGFRRNLWSLRALAISIIVGCLAVDAAIMLDSRSYSAAAFPTIVHFVALVVWVFLVRTGWVLEAAQNYANQLLGVLDDPEFTT